MPKETEIEGEKMEVYLKEEYDAVQTAAAEKEKELETVRAEVERLKKVSAEKTENFQRYNEMTEEQKKAFDENTIIQIKRADALEEELNRVKTSLTDKETKEKESVKASALGYFHNDNEETKKKIEENYAKLAGMPEVTPDEIKARAFEAARLAGVEVGGPNPLYTRMEGEAPQYKEKKEYVDTPEGQEASELVRQQLGIKTEKK